MSSELIRQDLVPIVTGYVLLMVILAIGLRIVRRDGPGGAPGTRRGATAAGRGWQRLRTSLRPRPGWPRLVTHLAATAAGGYLLLMAIVVLYYYDVARVAHAFLDSAFTGCALLMGISLPLFLGASWLTEHRSRRGSADPARPDPAPPDPARPPGDRQG